MRLRVATIFAWPLLAALTNACGGSKEKDSCKTDEGGADSASCDSAADGSTVHPVGGSPVKQDLPPLAGSGPTFSAITPIAFTASWTAATDDQTAAAALQYKLVKAATVADLATTQQVDALTGTAIVLDWTTKALTASVTGVSPGSTIACGVVVRDKVGSETLYPVKTVTTVAVEAPVPGSSITFQAAIGGTEVSWGAATDSASPPLTYKLVASTVGVDALDTLAEADRATTLTAWSSDLSVTFGDLGPLAAVAVVVKNSWGVKALYAPVATPGH